MGSACLEVHIIAKVWYSPIKAVPCWQQCLVSLLEQFQAQLIESFQFGAILRRFIGLVTCYSGFNSNFLIECFLKKCSEGKLPRHQQLGDYGSFIEYLA